MPLRGLKVGRFSAGSVSLVSGEELQVVVRPNPAHEGDMIDIPETCSPSVPVGDESSSSAATLRGTRCAANDVFMLSDRDT